MDVRSILTAILWLALLGLIVLVASRYAGRIAQKV